MIFNGNEKINKKKVKFLSKVSENAFVIDIDGITAFIYFSSDFEHGFKEGDEIRMENLYSIYEHIIHLVEINL